MGNKDTILRIDKVLQPSARGVAVRARSLSRFCRSAVGALCSISFRDLLRVKTESSPGHVRIE